MTNNEAIEILKGAIKKPNTKDGYLGQALDMAIEALKQETCEDCISRQAAIDSLNEYFARIGKLKRRGLNEGEKAISLDTIGAIKTLPPVTPQPTRWIPVSERLPEDGRPVLIYAWSVHYAIARYDSFRTENGYKKTWVTADAWNGNTEIKHEVIAWMPLPEPYKAESEDKE